MNLPGASEFPIEFPRADLFQSHPYPAIQNECSWKGPGRFTCDVAVRPLSVLMTISHKHRQERKICENALLVSLTVGSVFWQRHRAPDPRTPPHAGGGGCRCCRPFSAAGHCLCGHPFRPRSTGVPGTGGKWKQPSGTVPRLVIRMSGTVEP